MKCPKCNYTSFDDYSICKKCSFDLIEHIKTYNLIPVVYSKEYIEEQSKNIFQLEVKKTTNDNFLDEKTDNFIFSDKPIENNHEYGDEIDSIFGDSIKKEDKDIFDFGKEIKKDLFFADNDVEDDFFNSLKSETITKKDIIKESEATIKKDDPFSFLELTQHEQPKEKGEEEDSVDDFLNGLLK